MSQSIAEQWSELNPFERAGLLQGFSNEQMSELLYDWHFWARPDQMIPPGSWFTWANISGRGAGKTRTGAETVREWVGAVNDPPIRIALIAESAPDARDIMIEGESGILSVCPPWNRPEYTPSKRRLTWPNGSIGITFSGDKPNQLRGPQFHKAWVDELAKLQYAQEVWDNLEFGLRLGDSPQVIVTTTPRPIKLIRDILADALTVVNTQSTYANIANLAPSFIQRVINKYEGTRLGEQELHAKVLEDVAGALWHMQLIEDNRIKSDEVPELERIVVGVDPAVSADEESDETGIVVGAKGVDKKGYVLKDASGVYSPTGWASKAIQLFKEFGAARIVCEKNQGGDMIAAVIHGIDPNVPVRLRPATQSKQARAEPIAALMEQKRIKHVGQFATMEDQMVSTTTEGYLGSGSPDRMDAMIWAMTELMYGSQASSDPDDYEDYRR